MPDIAALEELLPKIEGAKCRLDDETLVELMCTLRGWEYLDDEAGGFLFRCPASCHGKQRAVHKISRTKSPDVDLSAADALVREVLPGWTRMSGRDQKVAYALVRKGPGKNAVEAEHPTSEPLAILAALVKAVIAENEDHPAEGGQHV